LVLARVVTDIFSESMVTSSSSTSVGAESRTFPVANANANKDTPTDHNLCNAILIRCVFWRKDVLGWKQVWGKMPNA